MPENTEKLRGLNSSALFALTIAGSDACGGAGLQADLKTFTRMNCYGATVVTSVTAQNTAGVSAVEVMSGELVARQLQQVLAELPIASAKTGMLVNKEIISVVAAAAEAHALKLVVDPVMVATSGARLLDRDAVSVMCKQLLPLAILVTPNLPEAEALSGISIVDRASLRLAAEKILEFGAAAVLIKGGHGNADQVVDVLLRSGPGREMTEFRHPRLEGQFHGTGCVLSAAITARLAAGDKLDDAVSSALEYLQDRLSAAINGGRLSLALLP